MKKIEIMDMFLEWFKETNPHLYKKDVSKKLLEKEMSEYVNDVLQEHMEQMEEFRVDGLTGSEENEEE